MSYNVHKRQALDPTRPLSHRNSHARSLAVMIAGRYRVPRQEVLDAVRRETDLDLLEGVRDSDLPRAIAALDAIRVRGKGLTLLPVPPRQYCGSISSVLHGSLGRFLGRSSEWNGYWLFGFLRFDEHPIEWPILPAARLDRSTPMHHARALASEVLVDQLRKAGRAGDLTDATLSMTAIGDETRTLECGLVRTGQLVKVEIAATDLRKRRHARAEMLFVAPHDSAVERQSARG